MFDLNNPALEAALAGGHVASARLSSIVGGQIVEVFESRTAVLTAASVNFDRSRPIHRMGQFTAGNPTGSLSPQKPGDMFFNNSLFQLEAGALINGVANYVLLGTLVVTRFGATMRGILNVSGEDPFTLLQQPFGDVASVQAGMTAEDALAYLWEPVLGPIIGPATTWNLDGASRTVPDRAWGEEDDRLAAGISLMADLGLQTFSDRRGVPVLRPIPDPTAAAAVRSFSLGAGVATMTDLERTGSARLFNRFVAIGDNPAGDSPRGQADVTDPSSPLYAGTIGLQVAPYYHSAQIADQGSAYAVAAAGLIELSLFQDAVGGAAFPDFRLDEDDVVTFDEPVSGATSSYRLDQLTHNALAGGMSFAGPKVVPLFAS